MRSRARMGAERRVLRGLRPRAPSGEQNGQKGVGGMILRNGRNGVAAQGLGQARQAEAENRRRKPVGPHYKLSESGAPESLA
jgi:hypothetical protein